MLDPPVHALVSIGSNLPSKFGSPSQTVQRAISDLAAYSISPLLVSSLWRTAPVDAAPASPDYINALCAIEPHPQLNSRLLLKALLQLETNYHRHRSGLVNEPRSLDLDLIAYKDECLDSEKLILPHPRAHTRRFVLAPLSELDAHYVLPGQNHTAMRLLAAISVDEQPIERLMGAGSCL